MIDLAGSESSKTETTGLRRKEGAYINKSLLTLGTVSIITLILYVGLSIYLRVDVILGLGFRVYACLYRDKLKWNEA